MDWRRLRNPALLVSLAVLLGSAVGLQGAVKGLKWSLRKAPINVEFTVASIPDETDDWIRRGADQLETEAGVEELGTHNYLSREYVQKSPPVGKSPIVLQVHLAYYTGMIDTVPHVPDRCLVGAGWSITGASRVVPLKLSNAGWIEVPSASGDAKNPKTIYTARLGPHSKTPGLRVNLPRDAKNLSIKVTEFVHPGGSHQMFAGYCFIANGGWTPHAEGVRQLAFRLTDYYAYYLKVQISSADVASSEELAAAASDLLNELLPEIMQCVPDWEQVIKGTYPADNPRRAGVGGAASTTNGNNSTAPRTGPGA